MVHQLQARDEGSLQGGAKMKRHFIMSSMLALAMGIAQAQTQQPDRPVPMQGGSNDPRQVMQQQEPTAPSAAQGMGPGGVTQAAAQSFKGCLNGSPGSWNLTSDKGKTATVSGADNQLSQYQGQEVRIQGVKASDGSITVSSIDKVSDTCANQSASNMGSQSSSTSQNDINNQSSTSTTNSTAQSTTTTQPSSSADMSSQSSTAPATSTTPDNSTAMNSQSSTTSSSTAPGATTPPVSNQTPSNSVGTGQTSQSAAQTLSTSTSDQNTASSTSSSDQNSTANQNTTTSSDQNANQGVHQYSDMDQNGNNSSGNNANSKLPQTASPLPLIGLLGMGSLLTGLISRRKK
jgi:hypothetical protein